jgi:hypothetical protein
MRANSDGRDGRGSRASSSIVGDAVRCDRATLHRQLMTALLNARERSMTCAASHAVARARGTVPMRMAVPSGAMLRFAAAFA